MLSPRHKFTGDINSWNTKKWVEKSLHLFFLSFSFMASEQRYKQKKIGILHAPAKHELSHSRRTISNRKAISSGLYKTARNSIYFNKH